MGTDNTDLTDNCRVDQTPPATILQARNSLL